jgi:hypothetical protein
LTARYAATSRPDDDSVPDWAENIFKCMELIDAVGEKTIWLGMRCDDAMRLKLKERTAIHHFLRPFPTSISLGVGLRYRARIICDQPKIGEIILTRV